jgi:hypothetical protein
VRLELSNSPIPSPWDTVESHSLPIGGLIGVAAGWVSSHDSGRYNVKAGRLLPRPIEAPRGGAPRSGSVAKRPHLRCP